MAEPAEPRLIRAIRELDAERTRRIKAERLAGTLKTTIIRLQRQRTVDAKPKPDHEQPLAC